MGHATPVVIAIVGYSGSGKTTLIEKLLPELQHLGLRVATIKHTHHDVAFDTPGKDSWRFKNAGAVASMLVTPHAMQLVVAPQHMQDPTELAARYFSDVDLVLAESFSHAQCPKIEVSRAACNIALRCDGPLLALVTDGDHPDVTVPRFDLEDVLGLAVFLLAQVRDK